MKRTNKMTVIALGVSCLLIMSTGTIFASGHRSYGYSKGGCGSSYSRTHRNLNYSLSAHNTYNSYGRHHGATTTTHTNSQHITSFESYDSFAKYYLTDNLNDEQIKVAKEYYAKLKEIDFAKDPTGVHQLCQEMIDLNLIDPNSHYTHSS